MSALVTLTSDFGARDPYVAAMKGVLFATCRSVQVVDLSHDIAPQDVLEAALFLVGAAPYFPEGAIHCVVVDPGVGTDRLPIVAAAGGHLFVCPDNGLLTMVAQRHGGVKAHAIANPLCSRDSVSATFHGRDVFAPAAARLAGGMPLDEVGPPVDPIVLLDIAEAAREPDGSIRGEVIHIDRFGNCITNIHRSMLVDCHAWGVYAGGRRLAGIQRVYNDAGKGEALALFGSSEYLEIAVNQGSAAATLGVSRGDPVVLRH